MTYEQAIHFWFERVNFELKSPLVGDLNLERMRQLLQILHNPHERLRIVHIAGSKGKGSVSAMLAAILQQEGYRTGLFTSPHLVAVEERIQVDQQPISQTELASLMQEIRDATPPALMKTLTFFEIGTALGLLYFVRRRVDFAILEVGLGGRFDSTNVCSPLLSVITSISFDHTQILGNTLVKIAFEKAGIIKPGVPVISGVRAPEAREVINAIARQRGSPLRQIDEDFRYEHVPALIEAGHERWPTVQVTTQQHRWPAMTLGLIGEHQACNAAVVIACVEELLRQGVIIRPTALGLGLARVYWPARLEIMARRPLVLLDCAHNVASARALAQSLETSFPLSHTEKARRLLIFAGNQDKDLAGMLKVLTPQFDRIVLTSFRNNPRCASPERLASLMPADTRAVCTLCVDAAEAWQLIRQEASPADLICITGSVFLAGELRPLILNRDETGGGRHSMQAHFVTLLALIPLCLAAQNDAVKTDFAKLDGAWQVVGHETNGKPTNEEHWRKVQFVFKGTQLSFLGDDILTKKVAKITLAIDPTTTPRVIDMKVVEGEFKGTMLEGIYEIKDDALKICFRNDETKNRPTEFSTKQGTNLVLFVLRRRPK